MTNDGKRVLAALAIIVGVVGYGAWIVLQARATAPTTEQLELEPAPTVEPEWIEKTEPYVH